jgi:hypothetical protein
MEPKETTNCESCGARFPTAEALQKHQAVAHGQRAPMPAETSERMGGMAMPARGDGPVPRPTESSPRTGPEMVRREDPAEPAPTKAEEPSETPASEDPVSDRRGRAPDLPGKASPDPGQAPVPDPLNSNPPAPPVEERPASEAPDPDADNDHPTVRPKEADRPRAWVDPTDLNAGSRPPASDAPSTQSGREGELRPSSGRAPRRDDGSRTDRRDREPDSWGTPEDRTRRGRRASTDET